MDNTVKLSVLVFLLCALVAVKNRRAALDSRSVQARRNLGGDEPPHSDAGGGGTTGLEYDHYRTSCPSAEKIVRDSVRELHLRKNTLGPQLLRLAFHDCFVMGCDASLLLDSAGKIKSEKEQIPNLSLKGFEEIDVVKSKVEEQCPGIVSCADIVALAARESVLMAGGQFYPVLTGRMDSTKAYPGSASKDIPSPNSNVSEAVNSFAAKGFNAREMIALIGGGHSTGRIHCSFILDRLFNFEGTGKPDPTINADFLEVLRSECSNHPSSSPSQSPSTDEKRTPTPSEDRAMKMDYEGAGNGFGEVYYKSLLQGKGLLVADQQLTTRDDTKALVERYASDMHQFRWDFGLAMFKLTHLPHDGSHKGEIRLNCRKVNDAV